MNNKQSGMTYIELLISVSIIAIILSAVVMLTNSAVTSWMQGRARIEVEQTLRVGIDTIVRDTRYATLASVVQEGGVLILRLTNINGDTIDFRVNPITRALTKRITTRFGTTGGFQPIAGDGTGGIEGDIVIIDNPDTEFPAGIPIFAIQDNLVSVTVTAMHKKTGVQATMHTKIFCVNM